MSRLHTKIHTWVQHNLINAHQAQAILDYEAKHSTNYARFAVAGIGIIAILTGFISLIAANWDFIRPAHKLFCYALLQIGFGLAYLKTPGQRTLLKESLLCVFTLGFLGGMGLISQIYHLSGPVWRPLAFWLVLAFLPTLASRTRLLAHIWILTLFVTILYFLSHLFNANLLWHAAIIACSFVGAVFMVYSFGVGPCAPWLRLPEHFVQPLLRISCATLVLFSSVWLLVGPYVNKATDTNGYLFFFAVATVVALLSTYWSHRALTRALKRALCYLFTIVFIFLMLPFLWSPSIEWLGTLVYTLGFLSIWFFVAKIGVLRGSQGLFNLATFVIALRFIGVYFETMGSLTQTGLGLIVSGVLIILVADLWHRHRRHLLKWMQHSS